HTLDARHIHESFKEAFKRLEKKVLDNEKPYTWISLFDDEEKKIILQLVVNDLTKQMPLADLNSMSHMPYVYDDIAYHITHRRVQRILESIYAGNYIEEDEPSGAEDEAEGKEIGEFGNSQKTAMSSSSSIASLGCRQSFRFDLATKVQPFAGAQIEAEQNRLMIQGRQHLKATEDNAIRVQEKEALKRVEGHEEKTKQVKEVFRTLQERRVRQKQASVDMVLAACGITAELYYPGPLHVQRDNAAPVPQAKPMYSPLFIMQCYRPLMMGDGPRTFISLHCPGVQHSLKPSRHVIGPIQTPCTSFADQRFPISDSRSGQRAR
ncbi:MAG: hypothetical protein Q9174_004409, partial [Haloplaca sp. 1 TL-2023]